MNVYLRLLTYLRPHRAVILSTWFLSLLVLALQGISVWIGAGFIERLLTGDASATLVPNSGRLTALMDGVTSAILQQCTPFRTLVAAVAVLLGSALFTALFRLLKLFIFARMNQSVLTTLRTQMFARITFLDLSFSKTYLPGEIASLFTRDVDQLKGAIVDAVDRVFMQPLRLIMAFALMFSLSFKLTLWAVGFLVVSSAAIHLAGDRIERLSRRLMERAAKLQGHLTEYLSAAALARALGREDVEHDRFAEACRDMARADVDLTLSDAAAPQVVTSLFILAGGVLLLVGGYDVLVARTLPGGILVKMILLLPMATYPVEALASLYTSVRISIASARRVFRLLDAEETCRDLPDARDPAPLETGIDIDHVSYVCSDITILSDVSLKIPRGSRVVVYGASGAGKTTLLSLIAGFARCSQGAIRIDGTDLRQLKGAAWRRRLGIVTQEPLLLNGTIRENLQYARPGASEEELQRVLRKALLWEETCVLPLGLDTPVGNRGELLSGGERQRLTIARALLNDPETLLMDEPTTMLDSASKEKIRDAICSAAEGRTLVLVTHDPYLREIADILVRVESGRIVEVVRRNQGEDRHAANNVIVD